MALKYGEVQQAVSQEERGGLAGSEIYDAPHRKEMLELAQEVDVPGSEEDFIEVKDQLYDRLEELYESDGGEDLRVVEGRMRPDSDGKWRGTLEAAFGTWNTVGHRGRGCVPLWQAAQNATDREAYVPIDMECDDGLTDIENFPDRVVDAAEDVIAFSQGFLAENMDEAVTVYRGVHGELAEQAIESKGGGKPLEIDPYAMESWSTDKDEAKKWGDVLIERELEPGDVGFLALALFQKGYEFGEVTALGREEYEIDPEYIEA